MAQFWPSTPLFQQENGHLLDGYRSACQGGVQVTGLIAILAAPNADIALPAPVQGDAAANLNKQFLSLLLGSNVKESETLETEPKEEHKDETPEASGAMTLLLALNTPLLQTAPEPPKEFGFEVEPDFPQAPVNSEAETPPQAPKAQVRDLAFELEIKPAADPKDTPVQKAEPERAAMPQKPMPNLRGAQVEQKEGAELAQMHGLGEVKVATVPASVPQAFETPSAKEQLPAPHVARVAEVETVPRPTIHRAGPIREIAIQLDRAEARPVDLHIVESGGRVHVEVRTDDPRLASTLRDNVGELVQKLDHSGYHAETMPLRDERAVNATVRDQGQSGGQGSHSHHQQQQEHPRGNRPRWLDEIRKNFMNQSRAQEDDNGGN
jgi:hypothetical protein